MSVPQPASGLSGSRPGTRFIRPEVLSTIRSLPLVAKSVVEGFISGLHRSPYHGFSLDFAEYRPYAMGDDIRAVDWKVYGRSDRYFVKKYEGDTNTQLYILLDCSRSMSFASHAVSKIDFARFLAASLAYLARRQKDAVGLLSFDTRVIRHTPARTRRGQYQTLLHHLDEAESGRQTAIRKAVEELANLTRKRSVIVLISDFYEDPKEIAEALRFFHLRGNDIILFHVLDPVELNPPFSGTSTLEDMETDERVVFVPANLAQYRDNLEQHTEALKKSCAEMNIDYLQLDTEKPLDWALHRYLTARARNY